MDSSIPKEGRVLVWNTMSPNSPQESFRIGLPAHKTILHQHNFSNDLIAWDR